MFMFEHSSMSNGDQVHHFKTQSWMLWLINSSPPSLPNTLKTKWNQNKNWQHWALLVFGEDTRFLESIFVCFVSPELYYFRGDRAKAVNKSYPQIFSISSSISWTISRKKNIHCLYKPFFAFFIIQVLENSDFSYLSLHDRLWLFRTIIIERGY